MSPDSAFRPGGPMQLFNGPTSSPAAGVLLNAGGTGQGGDVTVLIWNPGTNGAVLGIGPTAAAAQTNAALPASAGFSNGVGCLPVPANSLISYTLNPMMYYSCLGIGGVASIYLLPGDGV